MTDDKRWYRSKTIWGGLIALAAAIIGLFGIEIDAATGEDLAAAAVDAVAAAGALLAILGRLDARSVIA